MNIVEQIRQFVEEECKKPTSHYGYEPFPKHFVPMVKYAEQLAEQFEIDNEVIILAGWLHDIGSIIYGRKDHHITGAKIAEEKLMELCYSENKIKLIKKCILNHRGSVESNRESVEEQIIADADALCNFDMIDGLFSAALVFEKKNQSEARISVREKLIRKWNKLHFEESKKLIKPKFDAAMLLLE
jgi:uncharacterized protein